MTIFMAYDIRGKVPSELNEDIAYRIGRAFVQLFNLTDVVVGRDERISSEKLSKAMIRGITDQGANVTDIGFCSTPALYFASGFYDFPGAVMITASHLGKEYNGVKFCLEAARPVDYEHGIAVIERLVGENRFKEPAEKGIVEKREIMQDYINHIKKFLEGIEDLGIVVDFSNGGAALYFDKIAENFKDCKVTRINDVIDGNFPGHEPNPMKEENLRQLVEEVKKQRADLGIAFDGDADRIVFIDERGERIAGDFITVLLSLFYEHKQLIDEKILYDVRSSKAVHEIIAKHREKSIPMRSGHSFIKGRMRKEKALLAGELSGHYYFRDNYYSDSAIIAALMVLAMVSRAKKQGKTASEMIKPFMKYFASGEINIEVEDKDRELRKVEEIYKDAKIEHIDGISVEYDDWWFNLRKSNTEDLLRLNLEAKTRELMELKKKELVEVIKG